MESNYFLKQANQIQDFLIEVRRDFHKHPEIGFEVNRTQEKIIQYLEEWGIEYTKIAQTGICAIIRGNGEKTIALRADMDALPVKEENDVAYKSTYEGKMHACGHDAHLAVLLGAIKVLNSNKELIKGNIKFIFEPAEETDGGAPLIIEEGALKNPDVEAMFGLHVTPDIEAGEINLRDSVVCAASNPFKVEITGKGGHGAHPENAVDPIVTTCNIVSSLQQIISREISPFNPGVLTVGKISGGNVGNVIPEKVSFEGMIRTMTKEDRAHVKQRFIEIVTNMAQTMRCEAKIHIEDGYPCLYNDKKIVNVLEESAKNIIGEKNINHPQNPSMVVESFAYFAQEVPSVFYFLGVGNKEKGITAPLHNPKFDVDESGLVYGVALQCDAAIRFLNQ